MHIELQVALLMSVADHKNVVSLIGYCDDVDCMALVYAFVAYGNLKQHLSAGNDRIFICIM